MSGNLRRAYVPDPLRFQSGTQAGGDWCDVIPLPTDRVALVVGDVMGHGLTAAALAGRLRTATRAYAAADLPTGTALTRLDSVVRALDPGPGPGPDGVLASAIYAIWDPPTATITVANAGHPPPLLRFPDGTVRCLDRDDAHGLILGVQPQRVPEARYPFPAGSTLALYTDGLVESPVTSIDEGIRRLTEAFTQPGSLDTIADRLVENLDCPRSHHDNATLLLVGAGVDPGSSTPPGGDQHDQPGDVGSIAAHERGYERELPMAVIRSRW
ncbi:MAG: PP2C family protein-serine/threonine phosphatase [Frankia sp.]